MTPAYDPPTLTAGVTLRAVEALETGQQTFTRAQVAYLLALAYDSGRTAAYREDLAEMHSTWEDRDERRRTYLERIAERLESYATAGERINSRLGRPKGYTYRGGPVDWNTGRPARNLEVAA